MRDGRDYISRSKKKKLFPSDEKTKNFLVFYVLNILREKKKNIINNIKQRRKKKVKQQVDDLSLLWLSVCVAVCGTEIFRFLKVSKKLKKCWWKKKK